jgi:hypothetical protein
VRIGRPKVSREARIFDGPELKTGIKEVVKVLTNYLEVQH